MSKTLLIVVSSAGLLFGGVALAQNSGVTSGPANGKSVEPSTAIQKQEGRSAEEKTPTGAGAPGVEAKPGSEAGARPNNSGNNSGNNSMGSDRMTSPKSQQ